MNNHHTSFKRLGIMAGIFLSFLLLITSPNVFADLVTAYTFEPGTELKDVAVMLGAGGVASDDLSCSGNCTSTDGVFGKGLEVGAADYFVTEGSSSDLNPGPNGFTIAFYTYGIDVQATGKGASQLVSKYSPVNGWYCGSDIDPVEIRGGFVGGGTLNDLVVTDEGTVQGAWRHIALTFDGVNTSSLYIDGEHKLTRNDVSFIPSDIPVYFGVASHDPGALWHQYGGIFDDVAIFNEVLTEEDIRSLSEEGLEAFMVQRALVGYWNLDENSGITAYDSSDYGNDGQITGASWVQGACGSGLSFDGGLDEGIDYVVVPNSQSINTSTFTVSFWVSISDLDETMIFLHKRNGQWWRNFQVSYNTVGPNGESKKYLKVKIDNGTSSGDFDNAAYAEVNLENNNYYYVAATYDQTALKLYLDGIKVAEHSISMSGNVGDGDLYIGTHSAQHLNMNPTQGVIDEVRIYDHALTQEEINLDLSYTKPDTYYLDSDGDNYGDPNNSTQYCTQPPGYVLNNTDCDDTDPNEHPNQIWYKDADGDGYSDGTTNTTSCTRPVGYKVESELTATSGDCNDNDAEVNPGAAEVCNDKDDNCDGTVDEGFDVDNDGYTTCAGDCDDSDDSVNPGATEVCNGKDDDCDGSIDEGVQTTYFRDADGDGYGDSNNWTKACSLPSGYVINDLDCDDTDPNEHPNQVWYKDWDSDGYSDGSTNTASCTRPTGYKVASELTATSGDCNDNDQNQNPGAPEVCNGEDDDCDGETDEFPCIVNNPPEADAGSNQTVDEGGTVTLDGSNSSDPDGDTISYQWTQIGGIPATLSDPTAAKPTFVTPIVSPGGMILTFELVVKDDENLQDSAQVTVTIDDNGISGFPDDVLTMTCSTGKEIGIKVESDLVSITAVDPATIPDSSDKPDNLPYGLFDLLIKADAVGGTAKVTFYLESKAGDDDKWFKYKTSTGEWEDCSSYAVFNAARDQVTLTLVDGGDGDEGPADGWIVDPSGLSSPATTTSSGGGGGGGGGCFIDAAADG